MIPKEERNYWLPIYPSCTNVLYEYTDLYCNSDCAGEQKCVPLDFDTFNLFPPAVSDKQEPSSITQTFTTNYTMDFNGRTIPLTKTNRSFSASWSREYPRPEGLMWDSNKGEYIACGRKEAKYSAAMSENCVIESCSLHYMDIANNVLLYRYRKEFVLFNLTSDKIATFYPGGNKAITYPYHKLLYKLKDEAEAPFNGVEEWRLIVGDREKVLTHEEYKKAVMPWGGPQVFEGDDGVPYEPCAVPPSDRYSVFVLPVGMSTDLLRLHDPANNQELYCNGWYDITGPDNEEDIASGNFKDFFYPIWCRSLLPDPFWAYAAATRSSAGYNDNKYIPPNPTVDPMPYGSYAKHPALGEVYQFLVETFNGKAKLCTQPSGLYATLNKEYNTEDNTLYYPISLV